MVEWFHGNLPWKQGRLVWQWVFLWLWERQDIFSLFPVHLSPLYHPLPECMCACMCTCVCVYTHMPQLHTIIYVYIYIYSCCNSSSHSSHDNHMSHMAVIVTEGTWPTHRGFPCFCVSIVRAHGVHFYICPVCGHEFLVDVWACLAYCTLLWVGAAVILHLGVYSRESKAIIIWIDSAQTG